MKRTELIPKEGIIGSMHISPSDTNFNIDTGYDDYLKATSSRA